MPWQVVFHPAFEEEFDELPEPVQDGLYRLAALLECQGPELKRPHADQLKTSDYPNMKELRFKAHRGEWRVAFCFGPDQRAVLLAGANKSGLRERRFYRDLITKADRRYGEHLDSLSSRPGE